VDEQKLSQYAQGTARKSKREKEKEAAEAKRREEEENAAKAYADFLDAFEGDDAGRKGRSGGGFVKAGGESAGEAYSSAPKAKPVGSSMMRAFDKEEAVSVPLIYAYNIDWLVVSATRCSQAER
jgi:U2-associated protein SR140